MEDEYFKKVMTAVILGVLLVLSFLLLKPILLAIVVGILLAFIFSPIYLWLNKKTGAKNISAIIVCILLMLLIFLPLWFLTPIVMSQSIKIYVASQQMDFVTPLKTIFPSLFASDQFSAEIGSIIYSFVTKTTNSIVNFFASIILNFPTLFLQFLVALFTFYFFLRDKDKFLSYLKTLLPFSKEIERKLFEQSYEITISVLYGQVITGIAQGLVVGIGFFIFSVPNALFLTLLACLAGIFPIIGTTIIWLPIAIYLLIAGNTFAAFGLIVFGLVALSIDNFLRPIIVSKRTRMHPALILLGMIGGFFLFGFLGFILGPLILAYLLIILEVYKRKDLPGVFTNN